MFRLRIGPGICHVRLSRLSKKSMQTFMETPTGILVMIGTLIFSMVVEILLFLANWYHSEKRLHKLKRDAHTLKLRLKEDTANKIFNEYMSYYSPDEPNVIIVDEEAA